MPLNDIESRNLHRSIEELFRDIAVSWPTASASRAAFLRYIPDSPKGETVVQVQVRIVTDDSDFLPDFTTEFVNNYSKS